MNVKYFLIHFQFIITQERKKLRKKGKKKERKKGKRKKERTTERKKESS